MFIDRKVFVTPHPSRGCTNLIRAGGFQIWPEPLPPPADVLLAKIAAIDGLASLLTDRLDDAVLAKAPRLKVISKSSPSASTTSTCRPAPARGIAIGNTTGVRRCATADMDEVPLIDSRRVASSRGILTRVGGTSWTP